MTDRIWFTVMQKPGLPEAGFWVGMPTQAPMAFAADGPTIQAVRAALTEACEEVEAVVKSEYFWPDVHPALRHKFDRDMEMVAGWRKALKMLEGEE